MRGVVWLMQHVRSVHTKRLHLHARVWLGLHALHTGADVSTIHVQSDKLGIASALQGSALYIARPTLFSAKAGSHICKHNKASRPMALSHPGCVSTCRTHQRNVPLALLCRRQLD